MKAVVVEHRGEAGTLRDLPDLTPGPHEVLVRVTAAGVNPIDWKSRDVYERPLPFTLGQDFAGVVVSTGPEVQRYTVGDRIFGVARDHGSYAELTVVPEDDATQPLSKVPDDVGDADAAALPTAALTALACLEFTGVAAGSTVVIIGATGGVGLYASQMAKSRGARTIGIAHSRTHEVAQRYGVDEFIAYDRQERMQRLKEFAPEGADAIVDLVDSADGSADLIDALKARGAIVSTIHGLDVEHFTSRGFRAINMLVNETPQWSHGGLKTLTDLMQQGSLKTYITAERDLSEATRLLDDVKGGKVIGKAVITVDRAP